MLDDEYAAHMRRSILFSSDPHLSEREAFSVNSLSPGMPGPSDKARQSAVTSIA
jgi:hypothetical protein